MDVICPGCKRSYHETTPSFDGSASPRGNMVRLKEPWRKWGWCSFGDQGNGLPPKLAESPRTLWAAMDCPGCGAPLAPSGKLTVRVTDKDLRVEAMGTAYAEVQPKRRAPRASKGA